MHYKCDLFPRKVTESSLPAPFRGATQNMPSLQTTRCTGCPRSWTSDRELPSASPTSLPAVLCSTGKGTQGTLQPVPKAGTSAAFHPTTRAFICLLPLVTSYLPLSMHGMGTVSLGGCGDPWPRRAVLRHHLRVLTVQ